MPERTLVFIPAPDHDALGVRRDVLVRLARFNTAPDGDPLTPTLAYGPGIRIELPMVGDDDDVTQALVSIVDEDIAWSVITRLSRDSGWRLMDPDTGRTLGG